LSVTWTTNIPAQCFVSVVPVTSPMVVDYSSLAPNSSLSRTIMCQDVNNASNNATATVTIQTTLDTTPPSVPTNLTANTISSTQINLSWNASTDDPGGSGMAGYNIYRNGSSTPLNPQPVTGTSYQDSGLTAGTNYSYAVTAVDKVGK